MWSLHIGHFLPFIPIFCQDTSFELHFKWCRINVYSLFFPYLSLKLRLIIILYLYKLATVSCNELGKVLTKYLLLISFIITFFSWQEECRPPNESSLPLCIVISSLFSHQVGWYISNASDLYSEAVWFSGGLWTVLADALCGFLSLIRWMPG
jgi:hypothetical protein